MFRRFSGFGWTRDAGETANGFESFRGARPVLVEGAVPRAPGDRAQRDRNDDGVIRVAEKRDEIGHEVDRQDQVDQQQEQTDPDSAGLLRIGGQASHQNHCVGQQSQCIGDAEVLGACQGQCDQQRCPHDEQADRDPDECAPEVCHQPSSTMRSMWTSYRLIRDISLRGNGYLWISLQLLAHVIKCHPWHRRPCPRIASDATAPGNPRRRAARRR
ncbi:hypothetical protein MSMEI_3631 [Mycolicibacterium smegmatis MC2 155]|uniref:Uncharacterized protein n=1 Tax=Mycolicibacterium smegmatis (strain ATCC 700084 / mc(2)155) TaxID=246196 RepID=I7GBZ7_MYCS2|nr:hypothetical protein MSMEI_3631 [Mycolicibacterium smegmatis MC2 155]